MSKRKLLVTILIFVLTIALVVGASYLVSLLFKNHNPKKAVGDSAKLTYEIVSINPNIKL